MTDLNALAEEIGAILEREKDDDKAIISIVDVAARLSRSVGRYDGHISGPLVETIASLLPFAREGIAARKRQSVARDA